MSYDISKVNCISGCVLLERKASQNPKITCTVALCECASELLETDEVHKCVYRERERWCRIHKWIIVFETSVRHM